MMAKAVPFAEGTVSRPLTGDARLRAYGYSIYLRPASTGAIWTRGGRLFTEAEAVREIARRVKQLETQGV